MEDGSLKIPIFIINLKKNIERKKHMEVLCAKYNFRPIFVDAVDGEKLTKEQRDKCYSKNKAISHLGRELSNSEIGCALSHISIYKRIIKNNMEMAIILEDDVVFNENLLEVLRLTYKYPSNWDLILLGHYSYQALPKNSSLQASFWQRHKLTNKHFVGRPAVHCWGTHGYIINVKGAKKLLSELKYIYLPIDGYTGNDKFTNLYTLTPSAVNDCTEHSHLSNINNREDVQKKKFRFYEVIKKILEFLLGNLYPCLVRIKTYLKAFKNKCKIPRKYQ